MLAKRTKFSGGGDEKWQKQSKIQVAAYMEMKDKEKLVI